MTQIEDGKKNQDKAAAVAFPTRSHSFSRTSHPQADLVMPTIDALGRSKLKTEVEHKLTELILLTDKGKFKLQGGNTETVW